MVICVAAEAAEEALTVLRNAGEEPWIIGRIEDGKEGGEAVILQRGN